VFAYGESARHLEHALEVQDVLNPDDHVKRCDLLLALGEALMPAGEPLRAANQVAEEAFALAESAEDRDRAARAACLGLEGLHRALVAAAPRTPEWRQWAERADTSAAAETPQRVMADIGMARLRIVREQRAEGIVLLRRALDLARRLNDPEMFFTAGWQTIRNQQTPAHWRENLALAEELFARPRAGVSPRTQGQMLEFCGQAFVANGDREHADQAWEQLEEIAQRSRDPFNRLNSLSYQGVLATVEGKLEHAVAIGDKLHQVGGELGMPQLGAGFALARGGGKALLYLGRFEEYDDWYEQTGRRVSQEGLHLAHLGRQDEVATILARTWNEWGIEEGKGSQVYCDPLANLLTLALDVQDRPKVLALATILADGPAILVVPPYCLPSLLGSAWALLGEPDQARGHYQLAIDVCTRARFRPELALSRLYLAELLLEHYPDESAQAIAHLDFAVAEFQDMKMQPSLERALGHRQLLKA
jgi:tetratricopeptide (TPR) repeat protein